MALRDTPAHHPYLIPPNTNHFSSLRAKKQPFLTPPIRGGFFPCGKEPYPDLQKKKTSPRPIIPCGRVVKGP